MLNRYHRFHGRGSLNRAYSRGQTVRGSLISLRYSPRPSNKPYRVAVVVSRKTHKSAVVRNRIRRRIYEHVRRYENVPSSTDLIFTVFSEQVAKMENDRLNAILDGLLKKVNNNPR